VRAVARSERIEFKSNKSFPQTEIEVGDNPRPNKQQETGGCKKQKRKIDGTGNYKRTAGIPPREDQAINS
jgi:hypothetical protein